jgi:hypothetical protein
VRPDHETSMHNVFMHGWDWYKYDKKRTGAHYAELVFLHPVTYADHVVHSGASGS